MDYRGDAWYEIVGGRWEELYGLMLCEEAEVKKIVTDFADRHNVIVNFPTYSHDRYRFDLPKVDGKYIQPKDWLKPVAYGQNTRPKKGIKGSNAYREYANLPKIPRLELSKIFASLTGHLPSMTKVLSNGSNEKVGMISIQQPYDLKVNKDDRKFFQMVDVRLPYIFNEMEPSLHLDDHFTTMLGRMDTEGLVRISDFAIGDLLK